MSPPHYPKQFEEKQHQAGEMQQVKQPLGQLMVQQQRQQDPTKKKTCKRLSSTGESTAEAGAVWELSPTRKSFEFNLFRLKWCTTWFCPPVVKECIQEDKLVVTPIMEAAAVQPPQMVSLYSNYFQQEEEDEDSCYYGEEKKNDDHYHHVHLQLPNERVSEKPPLSPIKPAMITRRSSAPTTTTTSPRLGRPPRVVRNRSTPPQQRLMNTVRQLQQQQQQQQITRSRHETCTSKSTFLSNITESTLHQQQQQQPPLPNRPRSDSSWSSRSSFYSQAQQQQQKPPPPNRARSDSSWSSSRSSFYSQATEGSRHRRNSAEPLSPNSLQKVYSQEEEPELLLCRTYSVDGSVTRTIQDVTCALLDSDYLSPLDSEEEDGVYHGRHPLDTPKSFGRRKRVSIKARDMASSPFSSLAPRIQLHQQQGNGRSSRRNEFAFFDSDDEEDGMEEPPISRSRLAFSRRKKRNGSSSSSSSESTSPRTIIDDEPLSSPQVYLPSCNVFEQELLRSHKNSTIVMSGWVAYATSDSLLERFRSNRVRRKDLAYLIMLNDCPTLFFFPSSHKKEPPLQVQLSTHAIIDSKAVSPQHGHAVSVLDNTVSRRTVCNICPILFSQNFFTDPELTCLDKKLKQAPPFLSPQRRSPLHMNDNDDDSTTSLDEFAPFEQHEAVMHIRFALDSLIRRAA